MATDNQIINAQLKRRKIAIYSPEGKPEPKLWNCPPKLVIDEQVFRERLWIELDNRYGDIDQDWFDKLIERIKD
jgi:hypothetical protein